ncbi:PREDICTED: uncharacterized protein LOC101297340 [Fragaria vesca subsp. vesca]|uniref:uncharacterized protein LOC101297340 n=1 Tax=Fragaria vesca subsp. vesca TaxID=101020 RepID=UPI0002C30FC1|nr:PREDICTED: uncharacterized protein LOC101297340 [Fragaria vesca subsp. vesca]
MNSSATATSLAPLPIRHRFFRKPSFSCSMPRPPNRNRRNRRRNPNTPTTVPTSKPAFYTSSDPENLQATFDLNTLYYSSHSYLRYFLSSASDAVEDLQTLVSVDADRRIVVSCRPSTLRFVGNFAVATCAVVLGFRVLVGLVRLGFGSGSGYGREKVVTRRDRSLGGKEVVVARVERPRAEEVSVTKKRESVFKKNRVRFGEKLPQWWPTTTSQPILGVDNEEHQREANRLVRAITDNRMSGKDIMEDDIIHLRQICRVYGVRVSFDTTNTRDSLYRVSVDFVLNVCARAPSHSNGVEIEGEDARQFIAGLAENIGLENVRAGRIVSAAVAARTRSCFLQAWALVMQGKHAEAVVELSKICLVWRIFPPEESSPEMEMVARGLEKHLKMDQREFLMSMLVGICSEESQKRAAEALGLVSSFKGVGDEQWQ